MRRQIGVFVAACFYYSGLVKLARWWTRRSGPRLIILNYHRASGGYLRHHLLYLRRHYRMLHLEEALEELYTPSKDGEDRCDRRTPLVLAFDDGYRDNYTHAFALACELQIPITIFLIPGYVESGDYFWWQEGKRLALRSQADKVTVEGRTHQLDQPEERNKLAQVIDTHLRRAESVAEREAFLEAVILAYLSDPAEVQHEVGGCRTVLEQQLGHPVRTFAYPVGKPEHIGAAALRAVREAGYDWAVTTIYGTNTPQSNPHQLRRVAGEVSRHWLVMAAETSGIWKFFSYLWKNPMISWMERD